MKIRKIKKMHLRNRTTSRRAFAMKFIEVGSSLYPLNDRVIFKKEILPNGSHNILLNYTDRSGSDITVNDVTNFKDLPFEKQVEKSLIGKIKEIKL